MAEPNSAEPNSKVRDAAPAADKHALQPFLIIWVGQLVSLIGSSMTTFGLSVWIFNQTHAALPFAATLFLGNIPQILLAPLAGIVADRVSRRWVMITADAGNALVMAIALVFLLSNHFQVWYVYIIVAGLAIFSVFQEIAYTAFVTDLVPEKMLERVNGLMQISQALELIIAPLIASIIFNFIGLTAIILIDFLTFFFAIIPLLLIHTPAHNPATNDERTRHWLTDIRQGWHYLQQNRGLLHLLWYFAVVNFLLNFSNVLIGPLVLSFSSVPVLGIIQTLAAFGLLLGGIILSTWREHSQRIPMILGCVVISGIGLMLAGVRPWAATVAIGVFILMVGISIASGLSQVIFQSTVPSSTLGRVLAIRSTTSRSMVPLAFISAGIVADRVFNPLLKNTGGLAHSFVSTLVGTGLGRGTGLLFLLSGALLILISAIAYITPTIRTIN